MKKILFVALVLLLVPGLVLAQATNETTTTKPSPPKIPDALKGFYNFLVEANPILLLILGGVLIVVSKFAKWVGVILIIIAVIHLIFLLIR
jgi:hypothetical protein